MARQQYFSRVPSRLSLYNRTDGPDTFACSQGLSRDFVEKELSAICNFKPTSGEGTLIRNASLPPIYYQGLAKSGEVFQGRICFFPLDYTGERSSHIAHNIVLSSDEGKMLFSSPDSICLDASMFEGDENKFDFNDPSMSFDDQYPDFPFTVQHSDHAVEKLKSYSSEAVKRLILSMILAVCGKYKTVFLSVSGGLETFSSEILSVMNAAMQVIPYQFRPYISFSTYCSDASASSKFTFRGIPANCIENKSVKGIYLNLSSNRCVGISDVDAQTNAAVVNFLFELIKNDEARRLFLSFYDHVAAHLASAAKPNLKSLTDIIFIFRLCSSVTLDKAISVNDDTLVNLFTLYEKYRLALPDEYRVEAAHHLRYYADSYTAIPKPLFARISKVYPTEPNAVKKLIIDLVFDLLHTDIMRDKLFVFLKNNYDDESPEIRGQILENLLRVFYGGFLQRQILMFFVEKFPTADETSQDAIIEKLLLAIRTKDIRNEVVSFVRQYYEGFSQKSKWAFFETVLILLPDVDELTAKVLPMADAYFPSLDEESQKEFETRLVALVDKESRKNGDALLSLFFDNENRFFAILEPKIVTEWQGRKIFSDYLHLIAQETMTVRTEKIIAILRQSDQVTSELTEKIIASQSDGLVETLSPDVLNDCDTMMRKAFGRSKQPELKAFPGAWFEKVIVPCYVALSDRIFKEADSFDEVKRLSDYYTTHGEFIPAEKAALINTVVAVEEAYRAENADALCSLYASLPTDKKQASAIADFLSRTLLSKEGTLSSNEILLRIFLSYYKTGSFDLSKRLSEALARDNRDKETATREITESLLSAAGLAYDRLPVPDGFLNDKLGISSVINSFISAIPKKGFAQLSEIFDRLSTQKPDFPDYCRQSLATVKKQQGSFITRLFGKK